MREAPHDDRPVLLLDKVRLEHLHGGLPRGVGAGEEQAARGVAVEAVHGLYGGVAQLLAQDRLHAVRIVGGKKPRRLVHHEEVAELRQHADVLAVLRSDLAAGNGTARGGHDGVRQLHRIARLQRMVRDPDAAPVHPNAAPVDDGLRGAAGDAQPRG